MTNVVLSRRGFLASACCLAAAPIFTPVTFAAMPGDNRFVTIVLRGAMDGLALVQPYGEAGFSALRPTLALTPDTGLLDLDGHFGLHPVAADLLPLWKNRELAFVQAVSTPYRDQRSHFDGQDMLESGGEHVQEEKTGWLNRALAVIPRSDARKAIDINTSTELILSGPSNVDVWASDSDLGPAKDEMQFLKRLYAGDPAFAKAMEEATRANAASVMTEPDGPRGEKIADIAALAGKMLKGDYRIASFSITGWDTHVAQVGQFKRPVQDLAQAITTLKATLGPDIWAKTVVLAMTEFGRTVRENGSGGTDHGTGGCAVLAGGGINGGRMLGRWPGLAEPQLLDARDLAPTADVRELAAAMLNRQFDVSADDLTAKIFPGVSFDKGSQFLRA
ncbi:DUF1501 domain-containing protein [Rhizobium grahamii]|uniref:DUF1501 domain-containing protein n=1 Tax=Rhizobium grahamii TaxID=1120045 RepID=A0A5Q0C367_9HYPH|nr:MULTISPECIES: DUF1501 domain-containing protein [Rhizobium]QFY60338.1 DUF1501 domain-containing protein [Rhizobium grahamii]QRM50535.1 DUF1501 domain-containing protein [Rhizobium sp. BG6]